MVVVTSREESPTRATLDIEVPAEDVETISKRDYVKHWFRAEADALEDGLVRELGLTEVRARG